MAVAATEDDGINPLIFVLCGAGGAVLCLCCCAAVVLYCRSLTEEQMEAHYERSKSIRIFRKPIQRVQSVFSNGSSDGTPTPKGKGSKDVNGTRSNDTFFGGNTEECESVLKEFAQARVEASAGSKEKPRASPRASLQEMAERAGSKEKPASEHAMGLRGPGGATSPRPAPPLTSPRGHMPGAIVDVGR